MPKVAAVPKLMDLVPGFRTAFAAEGPWTMALLVAIGRARITPAQKEILEKAAAAPFMKTQAKMPFPYHVEHGVCDGIKKLGATFTLLAGSRHAHEHNEGMIEFVLSEIALTEITLANLEIMLGIPAEKFAAGKRGLLTYDFMNANNPKIATGAQALGWLQHRLLPAMRNHLRDEYKISADEIETRVTALKTQLSASDVINGNPIGVEYFRPIDAATWQQAAQP